MITFLSLVTSTKDYLEIVHKLIEFNPNYSITDYNEWGGIISYAIITIKSFLTEFLSLNWLQNIWSLPIIVPDVFSAMISEISVLDGYFHNAFTFLETPLSYGNQNSLIYGLEKFTIGLINSFFLILPTSAAHIILLRRFVFQGIEAGYIAGIGIIAGNLLWLASIIFGWRFFVIPWISLDIVRYLLGFVILIKYMWHAARDERRTGIKTNLSKSKIFLVNFLLALTEQTSIFPFVTNMSVGAESSILETFPVENLTQFIFIHSAYLLGILAGSLSLLHFTCWLWENPIYKLYIWFISNSSLPFNKDKGGKTNYYKYLNFGFLYLTMLCSISSIPYFGLDYTLTNPLGFISDDQILSQKTGPQDKLIPEVSFLSVQASDRNTRDSRGRHGRRERWKDRLIKYRGMDTSLYDQGIYNLFTIEDLNNGFDKFWYRRKIKNHHSRFRMVILQPWLLSIKKQLAKPRLLSNQAPPGAELFRMLYEQFYHPNFHAYSRTAPSPSPSGTSALNQYKRGGENTSNKDKNALFSFDLNKGEKTTLSSSLDVLKVNALETRGTPSRAKIDNKLVKEFSALRKFIRKINTRIKSSEIWLNQRDLTLVNKPIYSKRWKQVLGKFPDFSTKLKTYNKGIDKKLLISKQAQLDFKNNWEKKNISFANGLGTAFPWENRNGLEKNYMEKEKLSKKDRQILRYKNLLKTKKEKSIFEAKEFNNAKTMLHPIKFYLQREKAFRRKLKYYGASVYRKFSIGNNAPHFSIMMKNLFYFYKPTLRWNNTLKLAKNKQGLRIRRKKNRIPLRAEDQGYNALMAENKASKKPLLGQRDFLSGSANMGEKLASSERSPPLGVLGNGFMDSNPAQRPSLLLTEPTHHFRVVGKNASRYRYQIYKDVLHHWYYTPFNRILLKLDVDSFIRRQPNPHFLTKKDEKVLHLKRFLLSEHYETLRWYTYMQHYRSMKTKIGGTKSFASRMYNQQFIGTLKKIRHLFAITPSFYTDETGRNKDGDQNAGVLKFDQPLYNEYKNTKKNSIINESFTHEELLSMKANQSFHSLPLLIEDKKNPSEAPLEKRSPENSLNKYIAGIDKKNIKEDFIAQSTQIVKEYLKLALPVRHQKMHNLLKKKNYKELTKFIFTGQKTRGIKATLNQGTLLNQEKNYLLTKTEIEEAKKNHHIQLISYFKNMLQDEKIKNEQGNLLWFSLLKQTKKSVYDQAQLSKWVDRRIKKREKRQLKKEKELKNRLKRLQIWLAPNQKSGNFWGASPSSSVFLSKGPSNEGIGWKELSREGVRPNLLTSGIKNAIKDGFLKVENSEPSFYLGKYKEGKELNINKLSTEDKALYSQRDLMVKKSLQSITSINKKLHQKTNHLLKTPFIKTKNILRLEVLKNKIKNVIYLVFNENRFKYLTSIKKKNPTWWEKKDIMLKRRRRTRNKYSKEIKKYLNSYLSVKKELKKERAKARQAGGANSSGKIPPSDALSFLWNRAEKKYTLTPLAQATNKIGQETPQVKDHDNITSLNSYSILKLNSENRSSSTPFSWGASLGKWNKNASPSLGVNENRKERTKRISDNEVQKTLSFSVPPHNSNSDFLYLNTLFGRKYQIGLNPRRKINKNRRHQRFTRLRHRVDRPFFDVNLERKSANMIPEKRLKTLKDAYNKSYILDSYSKGANTPDSYSGEKGGIAEKPFNLRYPKKKKIIKRNWRKYKIAINTEKKMKNTKFNRNAAGKIRQLTKQIKLAKLNLKLQQWWWQKFLPNIQATTEATWRLENEGRLQKTISHFSKTEILERDSANSKNNPSLLSPYNLYSEDLQIGDYDFKPLAFPQALRIRDELINQNLISFGKVNSKYTNNKKVKTPIVSPSLAEENTVDTKSLSSNDNQSKEFMNNLYTNIFDQKNLKQYDEIDQNSLSVSKVPTLFNQNMVGDQKFLVNTNPLPFYAGWDESLRKFVVTNRLLSRREAGYSATLFPSPSISSANSGWNPKIEFTDSPLQGMNAGTTLYCIVPFTSVDPDQFFSKGLDGFAPIGWRRFDFTHTIFKSWIHLRSNKLSSTSPPFLVDQKENSLKPLLIHHLSKSNSLLLPISQPYSPLVKINENTNSNSNLIYKLTNRAKTIHLKNPHQNLDMIKKYQNYSRRLKKHYKRIKKLNNEKIPVFLMSGPLITEVLPIHYINIFHKQNRLSADRYIKRRLRRGKKGVPKAIKEFSSKKVQLAKIGSSDSKGIFDFTLRRRLKTRRKYHRKSSFDKGIVVRPRRHQFFANFNINSFLDANSNKRERLNLLRTNKKPLRKRPSKRLSKKNRDGGLKAKLRQRQKIPKTAELTARLRQLKRRVTRQVIKPVPRRRPKVGGFIWPGDYLRLEQTQSPKLVLQKTYSENTLSDSPLRDKNMIDSNKQKISRKIEQKTILMDLYLQPRKYLLEKHNIKVIKKKLQKAHRTNRIKQRIKELSIVL